MTKPLREWWLSDGLYLEGEPWPYGDQVQVREVSHPLDAAVEGLVRALENRLCECEEAHPSSKKFFERCERCTALASYKAARGET